MDAADLARNMFDVLCNVPELLAGAEEAAGTGPGPGSGSGASGFTPATELTSWCGGVEVGDCGSSPGSGWIWMDLGIVLVNGSTFFSVCFCIWFSVGCK